MIDRDLLELAAKAAGYWNKEFDCYEGPIDWDPLVNDGDALRLAVKLGLWVHIGKYDVAIEGMPIEESCAKCPYSATRRAIVRAAAEIGRNRK